jgi:heptosyltransferase III
MNRILVIATRQIGDVLLTTPLIRAARQRWPQAQLDVLGFAGTLGMLAGNPDVTRLIETPARLGGSGFRRLAAQLWRCYDLALVTQPGDRAHLLGWIAARRRSGLIPENGSSDWWKKALLTHAVRIAGDRGAVHVVQEKLQLLAPWADPAAGAARVVPPAAAPLPADIEAQLAPGAVALHVPSMWEYKQWPLAHWREVAAKLLAEGRQVVLTGGPGARDRECIAQIADLAAPPRLLNLAGRLDFRQLTGLFTRCALYIGPDTSVSHLAAATGIPVVTVFGPTNPMRWRPWPADGTARADYERVAPRQTEGNVTLIQAEGLACVPCGRAGCEDRNDSRSDCLHAIKPDRVLAAAHRILLSKQ